LGPVSAGESEVSAKRIDQLAAARLERIVAAAAASAATSVIAVEAAAAAATVLPPSAIERRPSAAATGAARLETPLSPRLDSPIHC
jgi:hypothetical protein